MKMRVVRRGKINLPLALSSLVVLPALIVVLAACADQAGINSPARLPATVTGVVTNANGPVAGAIVQLQGTPNQTTTAADGTFSLHGQGLGGSNAVTVTAWAKDHFIGWVNLDPGNPTWTEDGPSVAVSLQPLFNEDNHEYTWFSQDGVSGSASCGLCHREYPEWQADAHSQSAVNPRFITVFRGTNVQGQKGQVTQFQSDGTALRPDPSLPDTGPGFRLDNPDYPGNCATCHTPVAAKIPTTNSCAWSGCHASYTADKAEALDVKPSIRGVTPVGMMGIGEEGVACEFCHVVSGVILDPGTGLPYPDMPGILSMQLQRPPNGQKQFFGTLIDSSREQVTYSPLHSKSEFCAACHFGVFGGVVSNMKVTGGTVIYNSYGEWLDSPYSNPDTGKTCQDCHMPKKDTQFSVPPEKGGTLRDYVTYHDHTMPGASSQSLLWNAVTMTNTAARDGDTLRVQVSITNDKTGHAVPTDSPMRSVMLVVEARDAQGQLLILQQGPALPEWTGNYAGQPGKAFAKILKDNWTGEAPTGAFWRPTTIVEDSRLFPMRTDTTAYAFDLLAGAPATVKVSLVYRRAFQKLAQQKGWNDPDQIMAEVVIPLDK
jgi:hypothetical protein